MTKQSAVLLVLALAAGGSRAQLPGLVIIGNPDSDSGARWVYRDTVNDTLFDLEGVLFKPAGPDTFPAVILSHGLGGNAYGIGASLGRLMRPWGLVCIATCYTHAGGVPTGSPGDTTMPGASFANVQRAMACRRILASLGYVDTARVAAHGHSMGAFLTGGLVGTHPAAFKVASHTAGGVNDGQLAWTKSWQAENIACPYQMHHGDEDLHVPLADDVRMDSILAASGAPHELVVYPGRGHAIATDSAVLARVREWYTGHGLFDPVAVEEVAECGRMKAGLSIPTVMRAAGLARVEGRVFDMMGRDVTERKLRLAPGVYFVRGRATDPARKVAVQ